jgi:nifR3 family TIM-barrel protein
VAKAVVQAVAPLPVTAKIRIGWDANSINAVRVAEILQGCGIAALAVHGRTRAQGYSGEADWRVIGEVAEGVTIPVIGNGDLFSAQEVVRRRTETKIAGVMIGRAAMSAPWIFRQIKYYLVTGELLPAPALSERWNMIIEHCRRHADDWGDEEQAIRSMRARLMAYSKNLPEAKALRERFQHVSTVGEIEDIAETHQAGPKEGLLPNASGLEPADTRRTAARSVLNFSPTA